MHTCRPVGLSDEGITRLLRTLPKPEPPPWLYTRIQEPRSVPTSDDDASTVAASLPSQRHCTCSCLRCGKGLRDDGSDAHTPAVPQERDTPITVRAVVPTADDTALPQHPGCRS